MGSSHSHVENNTTIQQNIIQTTTVAITMVIGDVNAKRRKFIKAYQYAAYFDQYYKERLQQGATDDAKRGKCVRVVMRAAIAQCTEHGVSKATMRDVFDKMNTHFGWELSAELFDEVMQQMYDVRDCKDRVDRNEKAIEVLTRCLLAFITKSGISPEEPFVKDAQHLLEVQSNATRETNEQNEEMEKLYKVYESTKQNLEQRIQTAITEMEQQQQQAQVKQIETTTQQVDGQTPEQAQQQAQQQAQAEAQKQAEAAANQAANEEAVKKQAEEEAVKKQAAEEAAKKESKGKSVAAPAKPADTDPEGNNLISGDLLADATKLLVQLHKYQPKNITTQILAFKVHLRRKKYLLAVQALRRANAQDPTHPEVYGGIVRLAIATSQLPSELNEISAKIIKEEVANFLKNATPSSFLSNLVSSNPNSLPHLTVAAQLTPLVQADKTKEAIARLLTIPAGATLRDAEDAFEVVKQQGTAEDVEKITKAARERFPLANTFNPPPPPSVTETTTTTIETKDS